MHPGDRSYRPSCRIPCSAACRGPCRPAIEVQFALPHEVVVTPGLAIANYTMFEATRIPTQWAQHAETCALTVVPTRASFEAWTSSGVSADRLRLCPLGVRPGLDDPEVPPLAITDPSGRDVAGYRHRFLNVARLCARKNHLGILEAWIQATTPDDDAVLILKVNSHRPEVWDLLELDLADSYRRMGRSLAQAAPVVMLTGYLADDEMASLYRAATHYLSVSFGEGWDQPMMEAAAAGLELIAPRHSAYLEYLDDETAHFIPSVEVPCDVDRRRMGRIGTGEFSGLSWWAPDGAATATLLRDIIDGRAPTKSSPQRRITEDYRWETVSQRLLDILGEL